MDNTTLIVVMFIFGILFGVVAFGLVLKIYQRERGERGSSKNS